jgi:hypothetical protein
MSILINVDLSSTKIPGFSRRWKNLVVIAAVFVPGILPAQSRAGGPLTEVTKLSRGARASLTYATAYQIGTELARPLSTDDAAVSGVAQMLANAQLDWKDGRTAGIDETKLLTALNRRLGLENAPEYLQLRAAELRKVRVAVWAQAPEITAGIARKDVRKGAQVVGSTLSPFEAYTAAGLLIYQKLWNDDFVRTAAEEASLKGAPAAPKQLGLSFVKPNSRRIEFQQRMSKLESNWSTPQSLVQAISDTLKESSKESTNVQD